MSNEKISDSDKSQALQWLIDNPRKEGQPIGYFDYIFKDVCGFGEAKSKAVMRELWIEKRVRRIEQKGSSTAGRIYRYELERDTFNFMRKGGYSKWLNVKLWIDSKPLLLTITGGLIVLTGIVVGIILGIIEIIEYFNP